FRSLTVSTPSAGFSSMGVLRSDRFGTGLKLVRVLIAISLYSVVNSANPKNRTSLSSIPQRCQSKIDGAALQGISALSIGMNAVFPPWPIREFRDRSDGIPESGVRIVSFGVQGRFFWRTRQSRILRATAGSSIAARIRIGPRQREQSFRLFTVIQDGLNN